MHTRFALAALVLAAMLSLPRASAADTPPGPVPADLTCESGCDPVWACPPKYMTTQCEWGCDCHKGC